MSCNLVSLPDIKQILKIESNAGNAASKCEIKKENAKILKLQRNCGFPKRGKCSYNLIHFRLELCFDDRLMPGGIVYKPSLVFFGIVSDCKNKNLGWGGNVWAIQNSSLSRNKSPKRTENEIALTVFAPVRRFSFHFTHYIRVTFPPNSGYIKRRPNFIYRGMHSCGEGNSNGLGMKQEWNNQCSKRLY